MLRRTGIFVCTLIVLVCAFIAAAGSTTAEETAGADIVSESMTINATIDNNYAITTVSQTLSNQGDTDGETTVSLIIPDDAFLSEFKLELDGNTYVSQVVEKAAATEQYEAATESGQTASIVESSTTTSQSSFSYSVNIKADQEVTYHLVYEEYLPRIKGKYTYTIPLSSNTYPTEGDFSIYVDLESVAGFGNITVPDHSDAVVENLLSKHGSVNYAPETRSFSSDFIVEYTLVEYPGEGYFMNYEIGDQGYFMHVFCPGMADIGGSGLGKDIVFIIDKSGSMSGTKMTQTKDAFGSVIDDLRSTDRFNIVTFSDSLATHEDSLVDATETNIQDGSDYIDGTSASGSTDINSAMLKGLEQFTSESSNVPIICFLTDGVPTSGTTNTASIRTNVQSNNDQDAAVFCLAFGNDADFSFLEAMAMENDGTATKIDIDSDASDQIVGYYDTFSTPLVSRLSFDYGNDISDVFPTYVPSLYQGSECVVVGRYDTELTSIHADVEGNTSDGVKDFDSDNTLDDRSEDTFIARYWASQKIKDLQDQIKISGETPSLKENITSIALEYQFVTKYTSIILVVEKEPEESSTETEDNRWEEETEEERNDDDYTQPGDDDDYVPPAPDTTYSEPDYYPGDDCEGVPCDDDDDDGAQATSTMLISGVLIAIVFIVIFIIIIIAAVVIASKGRDSKQSMYNESDNSEE